MPKFELHKISFVNESALTETVTLSTMLEGAEGATRVFIEDTAENYVTQDNQAIDDTLTYKLTAAGIPSGSTDETQLSTWANAGTKLTVTGYAFDTFLYAENVIISFRGSTSERRVWKIGGQKTGGTDFDSGGKLQTELMISKNGLNLYNWQEGSTSSVAAGWSKSGGSTTWDSVNEEQDFSTTGAPTQNFSRRIYCPNLVGKQITFFLNAVAVTSTTGLSIEIEEYDESGSKISTDSTSAISAGGGQSVSRTLSSTVNYVLLKVNIGQNDSISFRKPGLTIGTSTTYIAR